MVLSLLLPLATLDLPCKDWATELSSSLEFSFSSSSESMDTAEAGCLLTLASFLLLRESLLGVAIQSWHPIHSIGIWKVKVNS